jgi:hypothetical protein
MDQKKDGESSLRDRDQDRDILCTWLRSSRFCTHPEPEPEPEGEPKPEPGFAGFAGIRI